MTPTFFDADDRYIIWDESSSQEDNFADWTLHSYDLITKRHRQLAKHATSGGRPVPMPFIHAHVDQGVVVWSATTAEPPVGQHLNAFAVPAAGGPVRTVLVDAASATLSGKDVIALHRRGTSQDSELVRLNHDSGKLALISREQFVYLDASEDTVVAANPNTDRVMVRARNGRSWSIRAAANTYSEFPEAALGFAVWNDQTGTFLFDSRTGRLIRLSDVELNIQAFANGPFVVWVSRETSEGLGVQSVGKVFDP